MQPATGAVSALPEPHPEDVSTRWLLLGAALPLGFGAWVPLAAGYRARHRGWIATGVVLVVFVLVAMTVTTIEDPNRFGGQLLIVAWIASGAVSFALRRPYARRMAITSSYDDRVALAEHIDAERRAMIALAASDPARAARLGVGRPDLPDSRHGHLVDLNHAPTAVIAELPGVSRDTSIEIAALRDELGGFDSVEDLGALMALHPRVVEALRTRAVTLPD
jgi:DNA uptake protein ComE-like DNA-binding protein